MKALHLQESCELHVHVGGCLYADDLLELGRDIYTEVDWSLFVSSYERAFGVRPDPERLFREGLRSEKGRECFRRHYVYRQEDGGDFGRFQAKFDLLICLYRYWAQHLHREEEVLWRIVERHRREGLKYVEYRAMFGSGDPEHFLHFHRTNARVFQQACVRDFTARYLISLPRGAALEGYELVQHLFAESPELIPSVVGLDFCFFEEGHPPEKLRSFFARLEADNQRRPEQALEVAYHVGEVFFDKSLESAVRWCHQAARWGARRLGHAIALGLDPEVAVARRPGAHEAEPAGERLAQITYDLEQARELEAFGVEVEGGRLRQEAEELRGGSAGESVCRPYTPQRLEQVRRRQDFVLAELARLGVAIESCPTSNLRIGGVPSPSRHPLWRFLRSEVGLVIGADDPGVFDQPLAAEVDWVAAHAGMGKRALARRLGDPRRFRFGQQRPS
ncbi:MAG: hypothetical protein HYW07_05445 [Candidatus Latescibacteria bacterium]|nr:hypothetical protein [Candidatus Latescibacterota bacterium]